VGVGTGVAVGGMGGGGVWVGGGVGAIVGEGAGAPPQAMARTSRMVKRALKPYNVTAFRIFFSPAKFLLNARPWSGSSAAQ